MATKKKAAKQKAAEKKVTKKKATKKKATKKKPAADSSLNAELLARKLSSKPAEEMAGRKDIYYGRDRVASNMRASDVSEWLRNAGVRARFPVRGTVTQEVRALNPDALPRLAKSSDRALAAAAKKEIARRAKGGKQTPIGKAPRRATKKKATKKKATKKKAGGNAPLESLFEVNYTVVIPPSETPTKWHPPAGSGALARGAFPKRAEADAWAKSKLGGQPYTITAHTDVSRPKASYYKSVDAPQLDRLIKEGGPEMQKGARAEKRRRNGNGKKKDGNGNGNGAATARERSILAWLKK